VIEIGSVLEVRKGESGVVLIDMDGHVVNDEEVRGEIEALVKSVRGDLKGFLYGDRVIMNFYGGYVPDGYAVEFIGVSGFVFVANVGYGSGHMAYLVDLSDCMGGEILKYVDVGVREVVRKALDDYGRVQDDLGSYVMSSCALPPVVYYYDGGHGSVRKLVYSALRHFDVIKLMRASVVGIMYCNRLIVSLPPSLSS